MPDAFATIASLPPQTVELIARVLETRAAIPSQQAMLRDYLSEIAFPPGANVLEVGCGTGAVCRVLAGWPNVASVTGIDPSSPLIAKARELAREQRAIRFEEGDGRKLRFAGATFDVVILHTLLSHVPGPMDFISEAPRVLKPGGALGVCDGDFSTATLATGPYDPLESCARAFVENWVNDPWLVRRMSALVQQAGFAVRPIRCYGVMETQSPGLTMTWVDRGVDTLAAGGRIGTELAAALRAEARRRAADGSFFGYMSYAALTARKPG